MLGEDCWVGAPTAKARAPLVLSLGFGTAKRLTRKIWVALRFLLREERRTREVLLHQFAVFWGILN